MKRMIVFSAILAAVLGLGIFQYVVTVTAADNSDVDSLRDTHRRYLKAWSDWDVDTIVEIGTGAAGFGHSTAFPRPIRVEDTFRAGVKTFYGGMDEFNIRIDTENYQVVGDTGCAWGHYACTTKQKDGPRRTIYLRYAHTFARQDGKWKLVMYHRSFLTGEDMQ